VGCTYVIPEFINDTAGNAGIAKKWFVTNHAPVSVLKFEGGAELLEASPVGKPSK
jgi:hypothetical protein